jgi:hypothetical protein
MEMVPIASHRITSHHITSNPIPSKTTTLATP